MFLGHPKKPGGGGHQGQKRGGFAERRGVVEDAKKLVGGVGGGGGWGPPVNGAQIEQVPHLIGILDNAEGRQVRGSIFFCLGRLPIPRFGFENFGKMGFCFAQGRRGIPLVTGAKPGI